MAGQTVGYLRVSSVDQNTARQAAAVGMWRRVFQDRLSGKSRAARTSLTELLEWVREGTRCGRRQWTGSRDRSSISRRSWRS